jgi:hypothetical protein
MLETFWNSFKAKWSPNRVAVALCALVAGPLAIAGGDVSAWSATHFPGLHLSAPEVTAAFIAGVGAVALPLATAAYKWFTGWVSHENADHELEKAMVGAGHIPDRANALLQGESLEPSEGSSVSTVPTTVMPPAQDPAS